MFGRSASEMRVLILAPIGRDAALLASSLSGLDVPAVAMPDTPALVQGLAEGAGCAIIAEEALRPEAIKSLTGWLASQPPWSDTPLIVLTFGGRATRDSHRRAQELLKLGNVTLIERPLRPDTAQSLVRSALRARMRQYEIRSRQEALVQANADLEQFAHSASHDLREPLRSIGIYSDLLGRRYGKSLDADGMEFLATIRAGVSRMDVLLNDLLAYAHASSIPEDQLEPVDARMPLEIAMKNLAGAIQESNATISVGQLPSVKMRASHLSQVFQNLIGNGIKYRKPDEPVKIGVTASSQDDQWTFRISDNGIGISPAYQDTIFGIFKRLHPGGQYSGTGMGLAICKRIVERYHGRIWVESEEGCGANFFFTIPDRDRETLD